MLWAPPDPAAMLPSVVDPKAAAGRNVLIVSTLPRPAPALARYVSRRDNVRVIVPVIRQGIVDWLANDERAFAEAESVATETGSVLPAERVSARAGESDVALALRDALAQCPADEIIVAVRQGDDELIESISAASAPGRQIDGVPVHVVAIDPR
jgi:hypothetical protein